MDAYSPYVPGDYPRVCDLCGLVQRRSVLTKKDGLWICNLHPGWRTKQQLDREIARQRQFRILPVPDAKPQDRTGPKISEDVDGQILNFLSRIITAQVRYEDVNSGRAPFSSTTGAVQAIAWAGRYLYAVIAENKRPVHFIQAAKTLLASAATYLRSKQAGFGLLPTITRSTDARWGGVSLSQLTFVTIDTAVAGLAFLHNYQVTGQVMWLESARAAASFLRNVQAKGSHSTVDFTSSDSGGTARLYTGGILSIVAGAAAFTGVHTFYPDSLVGLDFWSMLRTVDGDQQIGATGDCAGTFTTAPQQLLSQSITDLRNFWTNGTYDNVLLATITGLSATTPREYFDAYPGGSGSWAFADGPAATGTTITSLVWSYALSSLYNFEGATSQVTTIDDWLYTFTSNSAYELAATSASVTARSSGGTFDPAVTMSTSLLVRDSAASYAATKKNGSTLYDWGAFGLLSALRASRHASTFRTARERVMPPQRRYQDGKPSDGDYQDRIYLRGKSGLGYQTAHTETIVLPGKIVNDGQAAAQFGLSLRQQPTVFPRSV